jgi:hypothetical protein
VDYFSLSLIFATSGFAEEQGAKSVENCFFRHEEQSVYSYYGTTVVWNRCNLVCLILPHIKTQEMNN